MRRTTVRCLFTVYVFLHHTEYFQILCGFLLTPGNFLPLHSRGRTVAHVSQPHPCAAETMRTGGGRHHAGSPDFNLTTINSFLITPFSSVARLTRFERKGHKKVPKGPPFAYVFWKKFQRVPPLLMFFEKISKTNYQRGEYWLFFFSPSIWRRGHGPLPPPLKRATGFRALWNSKDNYSRNCDIPLHTCPFYFASFVEKSCQISAKFTR